MNKEHKNISIAKKRMEDKFVKWAWTDYMLLRTWFLMEKYSDSNIKTVGVDSRSNPPVLRFNPYFINNISDEELEHVLTSECMRVLLRHVTSRHKQPNFISHLSSNFVLEENVFNKSKEDAVSQLLSEVDGKEVNINDPKFFGIDETDQTYERYFRVLMGLFDKVKQKLEENGISPIKEQNDRDDKNGGYDTDANMNDYKNPFSGISDLWGDNYRFNSQIQKLVEEGKHNHKMWGTTTGNMISQILAANAPKIDKHEILRRFQGTIKVIEKTSSRMKLYRRGYTGLERPGFKRKVVSKLCAAADVSGSMGERTLSEVFAIINSICKESQLTFLQWDTEIKHIEKNYNKVKRNIHVYGRGGTDIECVFDYVEKEQFDGLIIISDMYFDWSGLKPPKNTKVLWISTTGDDFIKASFGWKMKLDL